jgi:alpha-tubulin suppressor-like RCC1 family protein
MQAHNDLYIWGRGDKGQLGMRKTTDLSRPSVLPQLKGIDIVQVALGKDHCAVVVSGEFDAIVFQRNFMQSV